jgi:MFS family permease
MYTSSMLRDSMAVMQKFEPVTLEGRGLLVTCDERTPLLKRPDQHAHPTRKNSRSEPSEEEGHAAIVEVPSTARLVLILGTAWLGIVLAALDSTIIATLSAPISNEFDSPSLLPWLATTYLISNAACRPIAALLTDTFGQHLGLIHSNLFFAIGNLLCGLATGRYAMIFGRVLAGFGGGGMLGIATSLTSNLMFSRKRGIMRGIAIVSMWYCAGAVLGAVIGGLLKAHTVLGWRLGFLVQVPPSLLLLIPAIWMLVEVPCQAV